MTGSIHIYRLAKVLSTVFRTVHGMYAINLKLKTVEYLRKNAFIATYHNRCIFTSGKNLIFGRTKRQLQVIIANKVTFYSTNHDTQVTEFPKNCNIFPLNTNQLY